MNVVSRRECLDAAEAGTLASPREHDVPVEPRASRRHLSEGHADVERDAGLFGEDLDRTNLADRRNDRIEQRADLRRFPREVMLEIVAAARV